MNSVFLYNDDCRIFFKGAYDKVHAFITGSLPAGAGNSRAAIAEPFQIKVEVTEGLEQQYRLAYVTAFNTKGAGIGDQVGLFEFKFQEAGSEFHVYDLKVDALL